jgi:hypothetical protein
LVLRFVALFFLIFKWIIMAKSLWQSLFLRDGTTWDFRLG